MSGVRGFARAIEAGSAYLGPCAHSRRPRLSSATPGCLVLFAVTMLLAGCGQKGPLVLPDSDSAGAAGATVAPSSDDEDEQAANGAAGDRNGTENGTDGP